MSKKTTISVFKKRILKLKALAKKKEVVSRRLVVTAKELRFKAKQLALVAKEKESIRRKLEVTAKKLAMTAKENEGVRQELVVTSKELAVTAAKEKAILASIGDAVMACNENGKVILFNRAAEIITGFSATEIIGKHYGHFIKFVKESDNKPSNDFIAEAMKTGQKTAMEDHTLLIKKNGLKIPVADSAEPIRYSHGALIGCVIIFRDITHEKEIDKAKSEFIILASHQLKTPPTAIKLLIERLLGGKMGTFTDEQKEYFDDIHSSNQRMIDLVNTLLNVSRIELGAFTLKVEKKDVYAIIQSIVNELGPVVEKKQLKLRITNIEKKVPLMLDESLFRMVINNLVTNAIHYTAEGGSIEILCKKVDKGQLLGGKLIEENSLVIVISDTGYGIPKEDQGKLFTKFFRADNARTKLPDGTGLGLYIVKSVLDHSGGLIWFTSHENKGSVFYVSIPMTGMRAKNDRKDHIV